MGEYKSILDNEENNEKSIDELVLSQVQIANIINERALAGKSDSWRYLDIAKDIRLGEKGLGKDIHLHFHSTEEVDIKDWNCEIDKFNQYRYKDVEAFKKAVMMSVLFSEQEKEVLLNLNDEALKVIARNMRDIQGEEAENEN